MSSNHASSTALEVLKVLYEGQLATLRSLSERSFSTTLQTVALNITVVAGLIAGKVVLSPAGKLVAAVLLLAFHAAVLIYLVRKAWSHYHEKKRLVVIQLALAEFANVESKFRHAPPPSFARAFACGSGMFAVAVLLAGIMSVVAVLCGLQA